MRLLLIWRGDMNKSIFAGILLAAAAFLVHFGLAYGADLTLASGAIGVVGVSEVQEGYVEENPYAIEGTDPLAESESYLLGDRKGGTVTMKPRWGTYNGGDKTIKNTGLPAMDCNKDK